VTVAADFGKLDHTRFATLLPSARKRLLVEACEQELSWNAELITFITNYYRRTYATVKLEGHPRERYVTYLVAFDHSREGKPYFSDGNYGFAEEREATRDMYERANR
jgi:hypothetical protein